MKSSIVSAIVGAVAGIIGGLVGVWWAKRKQKKGERGQTKISGGIEMKLTDERKIESIAAVLLALLVIIVLVASRGDLPLIFP